ncbi:lipoate-protein ligase A [Clostridium tetanomorphum]|uniref:lipoate--protein ligase n=1 Tax=Clostridium tetanomorphum TaxID=1553 RepID=UPI000446322A|nr:lipoate--protein ligase [Clostridium tetanomorphum]KAJ53834.1 lipoate-protein ligase A [Clostridium tetanomorphum DSM 665]MBP1862568.1 lipoate-protein ligase A [Clostridium tetanomorphum]NRS85591.1 lipoate-protein ligase A [Clostridium tetanomorphum]NRZ96398.1 lipoate-protein ligase A [Clostridium tetanomorphum]SQC02685.1 lipoate-protein ligase A [Clostridium tetanomorphum]
MQNDCKLKFIKSDRVDPYYNLALEEYLLNNIKENEVILYLWQNQSTVVIGKNQNPWKECIISNLKEDEIKIARRLSGGGAVFHDLGNLNFTFLMREELYNLEKQLQVILQAVKDIGIKAEFTGRNDITIENKKFSGNAFYFDNDKAYHHGTLLVNSDLNKLNKYLKVSKEKIESKGIDSIRSRVVNLSDIIESITLEKVIHSIKKSFSKVYDGKIEQLQLSLEKDEVEQLVKRYSSWKWIFGESPNFNVNFTKRFSFGEIDIGFILKDSKVYKVNIYSDFMNVKLIEKIKDSLKGINLHIDEIKNKLDDVHGNKEEEIMINCIKVWLQDKVKNM